MSGSEALRTSITRKKQKETHMSATDSDKTTFAMLGLEPWTSRFRESDDPARPKAAPNLKTPVSSGYIYNKTWKGPPVPVGGHAGRFRSLLYVPDHIYCPRHGILCDQLQVIYFYNALSLCESVMHKFVVTQQISHNFATLVTIHECFIKANLFSSWK